MSYTALYRKFRPQTFDEVKGQDQIVTILKNQIKGDRIGHAYIFTGTRGTGKTSVAKIFARAVNCEHPNDGSPCGECDTCKGIIDGTLMNVIEIDAASNTGVDNIRDIISDVQYPPASGKYKVYIIDEVHMLSAGAFNALLKTLEEPPAYVIFILATTDIQKVPLTILSRCQRYDFHRISEDTIVARLSDLLGREGIEYEEKALRFVAKKGEGSMRDSLSLLDECVSFYFGEKLTYEHALEALGASDTDTFLSLFDAIGRGDAGKCLDVTEGVVMRGLELSQFVNDFTWFLRNMLLLIATPDAGERIDLPEADVKLMKEAVEKSREEKVLYYINVMSDLSSKMRYSTGKRVLFEATLIRLCHPEKENDNGAIMQRLDVLEAKLESSTFVNNTNADDGSEEHFNAKAPVGKAGPKNIVDKAMPEDYQRIVDNFPEIVAGFGHIGPLFLNNVDCYYNNTKGELTIAFKSLQDHDTINYDTVKTAVQEKFDEFVGKHVKIALVMSKDLTQNDDEFIRAAGMINPNILEVES